MVSQGLLRALVEERAALGNALPTTAASVRANPLRDPVRYRACPACQQLMNRKNFGGASSIIVDVCSLHGTFFDAGELPRVLAFVRRGGLAKARAALSDGARPMRLEGLGGPTPAAPPPAFGEVDDWVDLVSFLVDVLRAR